MKRFFLGILAMIVLITAVGCGAKPTDGELAGDEVQSEVNGESAVQDEETLKVNDEAIVAYFQNVLDHADAIITGDDPSRQAAYDTLFIALEFLFGGGTIEEATEPYRGTTLEKFSFLCANDEIADMTVFDLSNEGKEEVIGIIREIYDDLGGKGFADNAFMATWGEKCLPIAEELHELYGEDPQTKELKEEHFKPYHYQKYFKAYAELLLTEEVE